MTVRDVDPAAPSDRASGPDDARFEDVWETPGGFDKLSSVSHRVVGKRIVVTGFAFFLIAGLLAVLIRLQLIVPENDFLESEVYNQIFTMHGSMMMFLFAVPMVEGVAIYLIPTMIGARDLVFPRLGAFSFWCYLFGGLIVLSSFLFGLAPDGGWFMYTPLSTSEFTPGMSADFWLIGITFAEIASISGAVELIAAILCTRAPGMSLTRMPIFAWYILVTAFMIALGFPPLVVGSILLETERLLGLPFFDPAMGGDPLLWQHLFWLFGHPEVYIVFLPAAGVVATILPTMTGQPIFGYGWIVAALVTMGLISFGLWAHHMFATGLPSITLAWFSAASAMVTIPTGIQIFAFLGTLALGRPRINTPMLFIIGFFLIFVCGGLTGVMLAAVAFNHQAHDSYFVVAHLHYVLFGGMVFPLFAGAYYWAPLITGRMMSERAGRWVFGLMFVGFNVAFLPMHVTGLRGMPRRVATYPEGLGWDWLNLISSLGSFVLTAGIALFCVDLVRHRRVGPVAPRNPWGASTLEWLYRPVTPGYNFRAIPEIRSRDPLWEQEELEAPGHDAPGYLRLREDGRRETMGCHPITGAPIQVIKLPLPTWIPLVAAIFTSLAFLGLLTKLYWLSGVGTFGALVCFIAWAWEPAPTDEARETPGGALRVNPVTPLSHTHVGVLTTALVCAALAFSFVFGILFLWNVKPEFAALAGAAERKALLGAALSAALLYVAGVLCRRAALAGRPVSVAGRALLVAGAAPLPAAAGAWAMSTVDPMATALGASMWSFWAFAGFLLGVLVIWAGTIAALALSDPPGRRRSLALLNLGAFARPVALIALAAAGASLLLEG